jgi:hypothetical protein
VKQWNISVFSLFKGQEFSPESLHKRSGSTLSAMEFLRTGQCALEFHNTQGTSCAVERLATYHKNSAPAAYQKNSAQWSYSSCQSNGLKNTKPRGSVKSWQNNKHRTERNDIPGHFRCRKIIHFCGLCPIKKKQGEMTTASWVVLWQSEQPDRKRLETSGCDVCLAVVHT